MPSAAGPGQSGQTALPLVHPVLLAPGTRSYHRDGTPGYVGREGEGEGEDTPQQHGTWDLNTHTQTLRNASMSPMAGMYSGTKGLSLVSSSTVWGV